VRGHFDSGPYFSGALQTVVRVSVVSMIRVRFRVRVRFYGYGQC